MALLVRILNIIEPSVSSPLFKSKYYCLLLNIMYDTILENYYCSDVITLYSVYNVLY